MTCKINYVDLQNRSQNFQKPIIHRCKIDIKIDYAKQNQLSKSAAGTDYALFYSDLVQTFRRSESVKCG